MNAESYVNAVARRVKCKKGRKAEIKRQLLSDIRIRQEQGEETSAIMESIGSVKEVAESFNENIPPGEKKQCIRIRNGKILLFAAVLAGALASLIFWESPKIAEMTGSEYFDAQQTQEAARKIIKLLENGDYAALRAEAAEQMKSYLNEEFMEGMKRQISGDWGEPKQTGQFYAAEIVQAGKHYAVCEVTIVYENVSVVYRISFDEGMNLAGIYMR